MTLVEKIKEFSPCEECVDWLSKYDDEKSAWDECYKPEWLIWYIGCCGLGKAWSDERKKMILCITECALKIEYLWTKEIQEGVDTVKAWAIGEVKIESAVHFAEKTAEKVEEMVSQYELYDQEFFEKYPKIHAVYVAMDIFNIARYGKLSASSSACSSIFSIASIALIETGGREISNLEIRLAKIIRKHYPSPPPMPR